MQISRINTFNALAMKQQPQASPEVNLETPLEESSPLKEENAPISPIQPIDLSETSELKEPTSSANNSGLVALGAVAIGLAGLGYGIYKCRKSSGLKKELEAAKEAVDKVKSESDKKDKVMSATKNSLKKLKAENTKKNEIISSKEKALKTANEEIKKLKEVSEAVGTHKTTKQRGKKPVQKQEKKATKTTSFLTKVKNFFKKLKFWGKNKA